MSEPVAVGAAEAHAQPGAAQPGPRHIAIIMDGNGRWAEARFRPRTVGHRAGVRAVRATVECCLREGIPALTLFAFSSENWSRPASEVSTLLSLFLRALDREVDELARNGVRLHFVGEIQAFPAELQRRMHDAEARTAGNSRLNLNIAVNYGGRWDLARAAQRLAARAVRGEIRPEDIDSAVLGAELCLYELPEPDLLIRTGGEVRISNFLLWQLAYTELYFTDVLWPDFDAAGLTRAIEEFRRRERRFGRTGAQLRMERGA